MVNKLLPFNEISQISKRNNIYNTSILKWVTMFDGANFNTDTSDSSLIFYLMIYLRYDLSPSFKVQSQVTVDDIIIFLNNLDYMRNNELYMDNDKKPSENFLSGLHSFFVCLNTLKMIRRNMNCSKIRNACLGLYRMKKKKLKVRNFIDSYLMVSSIVEKSSLRNSLKIDDIGSIDKCTRVNSSNAIVLITSEFGKWSKIGGLGTMIDELSLTLAEKLGHVVYVIVPYYSHFERHKQESLKDDDIKYSFTLKFPLSNKIIDIEIYEGCIDNVNIIFLLNSFLFEYPYHYHNIHDQLNFLVIMGKCSLQILIEKKIIPEIIVTNDWPTGLVAAYGKYNSVFNHFFSNTIFFHIIHNLDIHYQGRMYMEKSEFIISSLTELPINLLIDPLDNKKVVNPSRCALLCCNSWGTVSRSYCKYLCESQESTLRSILNRYPHPFSYSNGVSFKRKFESLSKLPCNTHNKAKELIQKKIFRMSKEDLTIPLFVFIGRITEQKGVHYILETAEHLILKYNNKIQFIVGGKVNWMDDYSKYCGRRMQQLNEKYPMCFWSDPDNYFNDTTLANLGADMGLIPSKFEPGGIVQHEFFFFGTPVLAFSTGGLKDTVFEFDVVNLTGNGVLFHEYTFDDYFDAVHKAYKYLTDPIKYPILRKNAKLSTISCDQVAKAWSEEFARLRKVVNSQNQKSMNGKQKYNTYFDAIKKTHPNLESIALCQRILTIYEKIPVEITYTPIDCYEISEIVGISGSFDNYIIRRPLKWNKLNKCFDVTIFLFRGAYTYKLFINGLWRLNPVHPIVVDTYGHFYNQLIVS